MTTSISAAGSTPQLSTSRVVTSTRPSKPMRTGLNSDTIDASISASLTRPMSTNTCSMAHVVFGACSVCRKLASAHLLARAMV